MKVDTLDMLREAILHRRPILFNYIKAGKTPGIRIGNPHAVFIYISKAGVKSTKVHIAQTGGVSDSQTPFPSFRIFDIEDLTIQEVVEESEPFPVHTDFNPSWDGYSNTIATI